MLRAAVAVATVVATLVACAAAAAATPDELAATIAAPWPDRQRADGSLRDHIAEVVTDQRDPYGDAMLGYALLAHGVRTGEDAFVRTGLRAIGHAVRHPVESDLVVFENMALASAYNLARAAAAGSPEFAAIRGDWEARLRALTPVVIGGKRHAANWRLVEAVEWIELARSGLTSDRAGAVLADPAGALAEASRVVNSRAPRLARATRRGTTAILSDPPFNPPAYHALSVGLLARAIDLLGPAADDAARRTLARALRASRAFAGPDGDLAYWGRSQEQSWVLTVTAYADGGALAARALDRLAALHGSAEHGLALTPALARDFDGGLRGLDGWVAATPYTGWTLIGLEWLLARGGAPTPGAVGADADGAGVLGRGRSTFAAVRDGDTWFAVKRAPAGASGLTDVYDLDMRYDGGLVALKRRSADGWRDVMPVRPYGRLPWGTIGPSLRVPGGPARFEGRRLSADGHRVTLRGRYRLASGRVVRRGARLRYEAVGCGVRMTVSTRRGDRVRQSLFFRSRPDDLDDGRQHVRVNRDASVLLQSGYASGADPALWRARLAYAPAGRRPLRVTICEAG
jgi:hypothetical protein